MLLKFDWSLNEENDAYEKTLTVIFLEMWLMVIYDSRVQRHMLAMKWLVWRSLSDDSIYRLVLQSEKTWQNLQTSL